MRKKILITSCVAVTLVCCVYVCLGIAQMVTEPKQDRNISGIVGKVDYVDFKSRGESVIVIKDKNGQTHKILMNDLKADATVLTTYRTVKDKKGKEKDVLISLSIIKPADDRR